MLGFELAEDATSALALITVPVMFFKVYALFPIPPSELRPKLRMGECFCASAYYY